jgi:uncharacterized protein YndB with AHSA1/START domain
VVVEIPLKLAKSTSVKKSIGFHSKSWKFRLGYYIARTINQVMDKVKFELEFPLRASPKMLFPFLSTPSGLSEWFCDDVNSRTELFTFFWDGSEEQARLLKKQQDKMVRFRWLNDEEDGLDTYFEFRIEVDAITHDTSIIVTDFAEEDELDEAKQLWDSQINELAHTIGA